VDARYSDPIEESFVDTRFVIEDRHAVSNVFKFYSDLLTSVEIGPFYVVSLRCVRVEDSSTRVDNTKATSFNLTLDTIFILNSNVL
jgi:hypothetical protein